MFKSSLGFSLLYSIYIVLCLLYPSIPLFESISVRHLMSLVMLLLCLSSGMCKVDWFVKLYTLFVFFYFVAGVSSGYGLVTINTLLGTYLAAIILYFSTKIIVLKYNKLKMLSLLLLAIFILDAIVSIGQYFQIPHFIILPQLIGIDLGEDFLNLFDRTGNMTMESTVLAGLFGTVSNGYVLSAAAILAWYPFRERYIFVNLILWSVCITASFLAQERSGFFLAVLCSLFLIYLKLKSNKGWGKLIIVFLIIVTILYAPSIFDAVINTGRYTKGTENSGRMGLILNGIQFIMNNPLGGVDYYKDIYPVMPHNLFVNMFLAGGVFGGIVILLIVSKQMLIIVRFIRKANKQRYWLPLLFFLMYLDFTGNSLLHNMSIVYGDPLYFIFWGVCACYIGKSYNNKRFYTNNNSHASI